MWAGRGKTPVVITAATGENTQWLPKLDLSVSAPWGRRSQKTCSPKVSILNVFDLDAAKIDLLVSLGARRAASVAAAAKDADIVITILPATAHVEAVVFGAAGILANIDIGTVLMEMSTIDAKATDKVRRRLRRPGYRLCGLARWPASAACRARRIAFHGRCQ